MMRRRTFLASSLGAVSLPLFAHAQEAKPASAEQLPYIEGSTTLVVLPDTQVYAMKFPELFHAQADWIVKHKDDRKIAYMLHEGDIVNNNNKPQWDVAHAAISKLDGVVPYALAPGNHDYGPNGSADTRDTLMNEYFSADEHAKWPRFGGTFEKGRLDNSYHTFKIGEQDWIVLALEWGPRNEVVAWGRRSPWQTSQAHGHSGNARLSVQRQHALRSQVGPQANVEPARL